MMESDVTRYKKMSPNILEEFKYPFENKKLTPRSRAGHNIEYAPPEVDGADLEEEIEVQRFSNTWGADSR